MTIEILTFGCRLNAYESQAMRALPPDDPSRITIIVNTCAVTAEAERQARQAIRAAHRRDPAARILVTGCAAQIAPADWAALPGVERVIGNDDNLPAASFANDAPRAVSDVMRATGAPASPVAEPVGRARAFVQVQQGCDHRCTFCVIPYGRGPSRSVPLGAIVDQVRALVARGFAEIVLTGVDIASFGPDLPGAPTLGAAIRRLLALVPELPRLRLSSLDPAAIDGDLWRLIAEEKRLMPHLHLSAQHGDDLILKRMKRRHLRADLLAVARRARALRPDVALGADLIAGFPTETDDAFARCLDLVEEMGLVHLHVFPYSPRPGTPAARMPQVAPALARERAARLRAAGDASLARFLAGRFGAAESVLFEQPDRGRTAQYAAVRLLDGHGTPGQIGRVRVTGAEGATLLAHVESPAAAIATRTAA